MCHFSAVGDLKMCRYLMARGASTTDGVATASVVVEWFPIAAAAAAASVEWFPMAAAAVHCMKDVCQWLYDHGAHNDISREIKGGCTANPLRSALNPYDTPNQDFETAQWLVLHGAIPSDIHGNPNANFMTETFGYDCFTPEKAEIERKRLLLWAENICHDHDAFFVFLCGTVHFPSRAKGSSYAQQAPPCGSLSGYEGIRKRIADYVGVMKGRNLRVVRGIVDPLKKALSEWND